MLLQQSGAFIEKTFKKGFILKEEALYKIKDIIEKRLKENSKESSKENLSSDLYEKTSKGNTKKNHKNSFNIIFSIKRDNGFMFTTSDIQKVVEEYNGKDKTINEIKISVYSEDFFLLDKDIDIIFNKDSGVTVKIAGYDQDFVNLLYSDLEDYLLNSVLKFSMFRFKKRRAPFISLSLIVYLYYIIIKRFLARNNIEEVISSDDIMEKMNYLLKMYEDNYGMGKSTFHEILYIFVVVIIAFIIAYGYDYLFPKNIFYIGEGKNTYEKRVYWRRFIIGTILIGGIGTGFVVSRLTGAFIK